MNCSTCKVTFPSLLRLHLHECYTKEDEDEPLDLSWKKSVYDLQTCVHCSPPECFIGQRGLNVHLSRIHPAEKRAKHSCFLCYDFTAKSKSKLRLHLKEVHNYCMSARAPFDSPETQVESDSNCVKCPLCPSAIFLTRIGFEVHQTKMHNTGGVYQFSDLPKICKYCKLIFANSSQLKAHLLLNVCGVKCDICFLKFVSALSVISHKNTAHKRDVTLPRKCDICDYSKIYKSHSGLSDHKRKKHNNVH